MPGSSLVTECNCNPGYTGAGGEDCTACGAGRADEDTDPSTPCTLCGPGTFTAGGSTTCSVCEAGRADLDIDPTSPCEMCGAGQHSEALATACSDCIAGSADIDSDPSTPCYECGPGWYSVSARSIACELYDIPVHAYRCTCAPGFTNGLCEFFIFIHIGTYFISEFFSSTGQSVVKRSNEASRPIACSLIYLVMFRA